MKSRNLQTCLIILFTISGFVQAETDYWPSVKSLMLTCDEAKGREAKEEAGIKLKEYLSSLNITQLIEAGRQCAQEADASDPGTVYSKETWYLSRFFYNQYSKVGGLKNIDLLFKEIENKSYPNLWRINLIDFFDNQEWMGAMTDGQMYAITNKLEMIFANKTEYFALRFEACESIWHILEELKDRNLLAETVVQAELQNGIKLQKIKEDVANGQLVLSDNYKKNMNSLMNSYNDYSQVALSVIDESGLNPALSRAVLIGMRRSVSKDNPSVQQLKGGLEKAVKNYKQFDQNATWKLLANISYEILTPQDADMVVDSMRNELSSKLESESGKKKKNKIKSEIDSLNCITKKHKEKQ